MNKTEKTLAEVDRCLEDPRFPNYIAVQQLEKAIEKDPNNPDLVNKLNELKNDPDRDSPRTMYGILVFLITCMGIGSIASYLKDESSLYGLVIGIVFLIVALIIFRQYQKEE